MTRAASHTRIIHIPNAEFLPGARLESLRVEKRGKREDLALDILGFKPGGAPALVMEDDRLYERIEGHTRPIRLRFKGVKDIQLSGLYENLAEIPAEHDTRLLRDIFAFRPRDESLAFFLVMNNAPEEADLRFFAGRVVEESREGETHPVVITRDWSSPPAMPERIVPDTKSLYQKFGGDPVTVKLKGRPHHRRLFIGGLDKQTESRPDVDTVLNLGEEPSRWAIANRALDPRDRWSHKGEGRLGMDVDEITREAYWVTERLLSGQRALVHCVAGMNRSATICCAVVMLLEGLSAEAALERVRKHHPWARPDASHWLKLRWLASTLK
ncbi:MAG: hypothetical protein HFACDABA_00398 [Anaerolineales bacterium]|nr:hypothetical protein [Anaerolineales bacterium]